jgi:hypothetical protein
MRKIYGIGIVIHAALRCAKGIGFVAARVGAVILIATVLLPGGIEAAQVEVWRTVQARGIVGAHTGMGMGHARQKEQRNQQLKYNTPEHGTSDFTGGP